MERKKNVINGDETRLLRRRIVASALMLVLVYGGKALAAESQAKEIRLSNGLKVFLLEKNTQPLIHIVAAVRAGVCDETPETAGLVHLLEHTILFRGTGLRTAAEIARDIQSHGAHFNAFTGQDVTLFEISLPAEFAEFGLRNQKDILFNLKLDQDALDQEKKVVLEEINQIEDDPVKWAASQIYQNLFKGHPYGNPLYGSRETIESLNVRDMDTFYRAHFVPSRCSLAVVGDFRLGPMEELARAVFDGVRSDPSPDSLPALPKAALPEKPVDIEKEMDVEQGYLVMGLAGPDYNHPGQYAVDLLTEILGRGMNPLLASALRERRNLVQTVSMGYNAHQAAGTIQIILTLDPGNMKAAKRAVLDYLKSVRNERFSRDDYYGDAQMAVFDYLKFGRNQIRFKSEEAQEQGLNLARSLASFLLMNEDQSRGAYLDKIDKVSSSDLRKAAGTWLSRNGFVAVSILPRKKRS